MGMKWLDKLKYKAKLITLGDILYFPVKLLGWFMVFLAIADRAESRNVVYNYVLQREKTKWLGRLHERHPLWDGSEGWWLMKDRNSVHGNELDVRGSPDGYIGYREVSSLRFYWTVFTSWGWLDDDSNWDTTDWNHIMTRHPKCLKDEIEPVFGNSFDLGDMRARYPFYNRCATWWWNLRNSAMNFQYLWREY